MSSPNSDWPWTTERENTNWVSSFEHQPDEFAKQICWRETCWFECKVWSGNFFAHWNRSHIFHSEIAPFTAHKLRFTATAPPHVFFIRCKSHRWTNIAPWMVIRPGISQAVTPVQRLTISGIIIQGRHSIVLIVHSSDSSVYSWSLQISALMIVGRLD